MKYETCSDYKNDVVESMIHFAKVVQLRKKLDDSNRKPADRTIYVNRYNTNDD